MPILLLILLVVSTAACDRTPDAAPDDDTAEGAEGPAEVYHRSLLFMAEGGIAEAATPGSMTGGIREEGTAGAGSLDVADPPFGMVLESEVRVRGDRSRRLLRSWLARPGQWQRISPEGWIAAPARGALRLMPSGPIRVAVADNGRLERIILRLEPETLHLQPGGALGNWSPHSSVRFLLRTAELGPSGESARGLMLDVESDAVAEDGARPPEVAFVTDGEDVALVLFGQSGESPAGWLRREDGSEPLEDIRIERQGIEGGAVWRVLRGTSGPLAELLERRPAARDEQAEQDAIPPIVLTGWILVDGERRDVAGFMRTPL